MEDNKPELKVDTNITPSMLDINHTESVMRESIDIAKLNLDPVQMVSLNSMIAHAAQEITRLSGGVTQAQFLQHLNEKVLGKWE